MKHVHEAMRFNPGQYEELRELVLRGEGLHLEFKRKAAFPEKIVREMIAFANTKGGTLLLGVGDDGSLPGLKYPEDEAYVVQQALQRCKPSLSIIENYIPTENMRMIIQYVIPESTRKPHYLMLEGNRKEAYVRNADKSILASREMCEIIRRAQRNKDIRFTYGDHERQLIQYLDTHASITLPQFMTITGLRRYYASRKLVLLVLADVLTITATEKGDIYSLKHSLIYSQSMMA